MQSLSVAPYSSFDFSSFRTVILCILLGSIFFSSVSEIFFPSTMQSVFFMISSEVSFLVIVMVFIGSVEVAAFPLVCMIRAPFSPSFP